MSPESTITAASALIRELPEYQEMVSKLPPLPSAADIVRLVGAKDNDSCDHCGLENIEVLVLKTKHDTCKIGCDCAAKHLRNQIGLKETRTTWQKLGRVASVNSYLSPFVQLA